MLQSEFEAGSGTYKRGGFLYASIVGQKQVTNSEGDAQSKIVSVISKGAAKRVVPKVGDVITGRVSTYCDLDLVAQTRFLDLKEQLAVWNFQEESVSNP